MAQQASPVIAQTLAQVSTLDDVIISLPPVQDVPQDSMFPTFALALEFAYSGSAHVQASAVLPLWALAVALQVCGDCSTVAVQTQSSTSLLRWLPAVLSEHHQCQRSAAAVLSCWQWVCNSLDASSCAALLAW